MYKTVWNFMNHHVKSSHVSAMFLAALLAGWTPVSYTHLTLPTKA